MVKIEAKSSITRSHISIWRRVSGDFNENIGQERPRQILRRERSASYNMITINVDVMLARRKMSVTELSEKVGITMANISVLKNGKAKAIRLSTLEAICVALECQPGDILEYRKS